MVNIRIVFVPLTAFSDALCMGGFDFTTQTECLFIG